MLQHGTIAYKHGSNLVEDSDLAVKPGEVRGLIAPNGYGKSTLMNVLAGNLPQALTCGTVTLGHSVASVSLLREHVLYVSSEGGLLMPTLTGEEHLRMTRDLWKSPIPIEHVVSELQIGDLLPLQAGKMSQGMKQQLALAIARQSGVMYVLLDEPTNALDQGKSDMALSCMRAMAEDGVGVLVSSHLLGMLEEVSSGFYFMRNRKLVWREGGTGTSCRDYYQRYYGKCGIVSTPDSR